MKEKVLALLKPLLAARGFKSKELEGLAEIAAKNLTDASTDEEINNVVNGIVPFADLMQKVGNRYATEVEKKYEGWVKPGGKEITEGNPSGGGKPSGVNKPTLTAEELAALIETKVSERLRPYEEREEKQRLQNLLFANEKVKSLPESFRSKYTLDKEENLDSLATKMETDFAELKQELLKSGTFATPPTSGGAGESDDLINALKRMGSGGK